MNWGDGGIIWRVLAAVIIIGAASILYAWCDFPQEAVVMVMGAIVGFFFGQYAQTPEG